MTDEYEYDDKTGRELIVRRGQEFKIDINLSRPFKPNKERIILQLTASAKCPRPTDGTVINLDINGTNKDGNWMAKMESSEDKSIKVTVNSAPNAIVGTYKVTVKVENSANGMETVFPQTRKVWVLFNPWCKQDVVYMEDKAERDEYVMADTGRIWRGSERNNRPKPWVFGQFDLDVHRVVFELLEAHVKPKDRRSAVKVSRWFSYIINEFVLVGNWSGNYEGGTRPTAWKGSVKIIEEYGTTKKPVKFGQCWVFSGVLTTFLRCVGIPTRSVTNFDSAHDTELNMTIDNYQDAEGNELSSSFFAFRVGEKDRERSTADSIWNFHVWNESWMTRKDLHGSDFDGWQAVDSTPQELSEGKYQCGPAPLNAIKRGIVNVGYDAGFVFGEVNADRVTWLVEAYPNHREGLKYTQLSCQKDSAGHVISTKQVGSKERNDVTLLYKFKEGSPEERAAVEEAVSKGINCGLYDADGIPDEISVNVQCKDDLWIGDSFSVTIETKNESDYAKDIHIKTIVSSVLYTGLPKATIKTEETGYFELGSKESKLNEVLVDYEDYGSKLDDEGMFLVHVIVKVKGSTRPITKRENIRLKQPDLDVTAEVDGSKVALTAEFKNPLNKTLKDCEFSVEAPKLVKPFKVKREDIGPKESITFKYSFQARTTGRKTVVVELDTHLLKDIDGEVDVEVKP
nr:protein-glutamine gamma-glutamyltransferase K-like [Lytechinus pictus]